MNIISFDHYPREAFSFVSEALPAAIDDAHGPASPTMQAIRSFMQMHEISLNALMEAHAAGSLNPMVKSLIEQAGGIDSLNRHVNGTDLCLTLRRLASERWGMMARAVLESWSITSTMDFGRIVFGMVEHGAMCKRPNDEIEDFKNVFDFSDFDNYKIDAADF